MNIHKNWYYILNCTWGLPMTALGMVATIILMALGFMPKQDKLTYYFLIPGHWGGITIGACIIICEETEYLLNHEFGHTIQNAVFGILMPFIGLASLTRCVVRNIQQKNGKQLTPYDSVWFEKQATEWGTNYTVDN